MIVPSLSAVMLMPLAVQVPSEFTVAVIGAVVVVPSVAVTVTVAPNSPFHWLRCSPRSRR